MLKGNAIIGQSGGPTSVINSSLAGVIDGATRSPRIESIYGMNYGIEGFMQEKLIDLGNQPKEILVSHRDYERVYHSTQNGISAIFTKRDDWIFSKDYTYELLISHFKTHSLKGFGCDDMNAGAIAAGVIIHYLKENYKTRLENSGWVFIFNFYSTFNINFR